MIVILIILVTLIFNIVVRIYIENDIISQLDKITSRTVNTALHQGPGLYPGSRKPPALISESTNTDTGNEKIFRYYFMLNRSLKEPLSLLNADYILLDKDKHLIPPPISEETDLTYFYNQLVSELERSSENFSKQEYLKLNLSGTNYIAVVRPLSQNKASGLGWIIIFSSLQKVNQLQFKINAILLIILACSSFVAVLLSSSLSKKLSMPFYSLNEHIKAIAKRDFGNQVTMPVYDELQEVVNSINVMSEKLGIYDKAQKTFLQNVSHEFRTPLMSIQSYAEGIKYNVIDSNTAVDIILEESRRMAKLLEELLYLSRLESIEENYHFEKISLNKLIECCVDRINGIALKGNINIVVKKTGDMAEISGDEEKLSRAITNIISNCIRYARTTVTIDISTQMEDKVCIKIYDDGPGLESNDLPNVFERFYKGQKGNYGLGLAISKNVIEKHNGRISAKNLEAGGALFIIEI